MARYASGKKAWGYSDRSGFRYRLSEMVTEWNGSKVGPDEYEAKHPQLEPIRPGSDPQTLYQPRPDQRTETAVERLLPLNPFESPTPTGVTVNYTVTVANVGGVNVFVLDGVNNPAITFVKGNTYVFDVSDGTVGGHPLAFRTSADASYTTGVTTSGSAGNAGATVTIVVAANAPATLKYYCTVHGNAMGNTITVNDAPSAVVKVYEPSHGRASSQTVRFRSTVGFDGISQATLESSSGYTITVVDVNTYTIPITNTAIVGNLRGGGGRATAGPVTLVT